MKYSRKRPLRLTTLFSGYDSQALSLRQLRRDYPDLDFELVAWCEFDETAIKAHDILFPGCKDRNVGDITKADFSKMPDTDVVTWSFPCTSISNSGKREGLAKGSGTASSLAWYAIEYFRVKRPKYLLMENVKALTQAKFAQDFALIRKELEDMGYVNFWKVLNATDYGVAQNRERVFMMSVLRTEADDMPIYNFPAKMPLTKCVEDYMEPIEDVPESCFIDQERITNKVLSDILNQQNVREAMEKMYHEEWKERLADTH